jgi:DNA-directed RNA polymerase subunit RPC12/RpoP
MMGSTLSANRVEFVCENCLRSQRAGKDETVMCTHCGIAMLADARDEDVATSPEELAFLRYLRRPQRAA